MMHRRRLISRGPAALFLAAAGFVLAAQCVLAPLRAQVRPKDLPEKYRTWLQEEVAYIITPDEREVFLGLANDRQRDLFIEAFWKHRDPSPGTEANEYRDEHMRRLDHANRYFRGGGKPGWQTDRGKVYIILGPPRSTRSYNGIATVYESEVWSYDGLDLPGIPMAVDLLFFRKNGMGDFVLYDPAGDGPWSLMSNYDGHTGEYRASYEALSLIEPELAMASISFVPGETVANMPSLMSMAVLQNIDAAAYRKVEDTYAKKFREYKDVVEVEYSSNYIDSGSIVEVYQDAGGTSYINYLLEPASLSVGRTGDRIGTDLIFNGILTDGQGRTIFQLEKKIPLSFTVEEFEKMRTRPFSFSGLFPAIPGAYRLSVLMKNSLSKEFTSLERDIVVAPPAGKPRLSDLLLAFNAVRQSSDQSALKPFRVRDIQLYCQPGETFLVKDNVFAYAQVLGASPELRKTGSLRFTLESDRGPLETKTQPLPAGPDALEVFALQAAGPGYYRIVVALLDAAGQELDRRKKDFQVSTNDYLPRPWVLSQSVMDGAPASFTDNILGRQWAAAGDLAKAAPLLERARAADPESRAYALDLARAYFATDRMPEVLATLRPFAPEAEKDFELGCLFADTQRRMGRLAEAMKLYQDLLSSFGLNTRVLNGIGECHVALGETAAAVAAWKKSLEIDPSQAGLRERIAAAEKRR